MAAWQPCPAGSKANCSALLWKGLTLNFFPRILGSPFQHGFHHLANRSSTICLESSPKGMEPAKYSQGAQQTFAASLRRLLSKLHLPQPISPACDVSDILKPPLRFSVPFPLWSLSLPSHYHSSPLLLQLISPNTSLHARRRALDDANAPFPAHGSSDAVGDRKARGLTLHSLFQDQLLHTTPQLCLTAPYNWHRVHTTLAWAPLSLVFPPLPQ